MSSSYPGNIPYMLELISKALISKVDVSKLSVKLLKEGKPFPLPELKILDVGTGFGKWAFLIRDTFEVMIGQNFEKKDWKIDLTGIEPFKKCITPVQKEIYNKIINKDIHSALPELGKYDLIILGDVIEHFEQETAHKLLKELFRHSENILISTPYGFMPQGQWGGNVYEEHKSGWKLEDFKDYKIIEHKIIDDEFGKTLIKELGKRALKNPKLLPVWAYSKILKIKLLVLWIKSI